MTNPRLDIQGIDGVSPIFAYQAGKVAFAGVGSGWRTGNIVVVDHGKGVTTMYMHNSVNLARTGQVVSQGQQIAVVGTGGNGAGLPPHVHFQMTINGKPVDPAKYIRPCSE